MINDNLNENIRSPWVGFGSDFLTYVEEDTQKASECAKRFLRTLAWVGFGREFLDYLGRDCQAAVYSAKDFLKYFYRNNIDT